MSNTWEVQEATACFGEMLETCLADGPQIVTKSGVEAAVLVPTSEYRLRVRMTKPSLKQLLLAPQPRTDTLTPARRDSLGGGRQKG